MESTTMHYPECLQAIMELCRPADREQLPLDRALHRIAIVDHHSRWPLPAYRQSLRDGFVVASSAGEAGDGPLSIVGTIGAGDTVLPDLPPDSALRIMTGAMVPEAGVRVIPQEECQVSGTMVKVPAATLHTDASYIQEAGHTMAAGTLVVRAGQILEPGHLELLAATGHSQVATGRQPRIGYFCTGSELVPPGQEIIAGQKVSSNCILLAAIIHQYGGEPVPLGIVPDTREALASVFAGLDRIGCDLVISTGGMGGGKFDLLEETFRNEGGRLIYNRLAMTPGKNSLCGQMGSTLFFGLPGPPNAVNCLMHAIIGPVILRLQGYQGDTPIKRHAFLENGVTIRRPGLKQLHGATVRLHNGRLLVRECPKRGVADSYLVLAAERTAYSQDELIETIVAAPPWGTAG